MVVFTVGHSMHAIERLIELLSAQGVELVADVRRWPRSRRHPQFDDDALAVELATRAGIGYEHLPELGGRREPRDDSPNGAWEVPQFRGYADHVASAEFARGLERLETLARERPTAVMCAEGDWRRCHRRILSDVLVARGWEVRHIAPDGSTSPHALTEFAVVEDGLPRYPAAQLELGI